MTFQKFTLAHAIHNSENIQLEGVKIGKNQVSITLSRIHAREVIPAYLIDREWDEFHFGESTIDSFDFHCPTTGMILATYYQGQQGSNLTINHNAN